MEDLENIALPERSDINLKTPGTSKVHWEDILVRS